ncbi:hypothetical protein EON64_11210 [archaeon]|nr:MAG: hypothetical protein EON64_11210 [archaeon]
MESNEGATALDKVQLLIGTQLRVLISDGRLIQGEFQCIDSDMNIILNEATEFHGVDDGEHCVYVYVCFLLSSSVSYIAQSESAAYSQLFVS